MPKTLINSVNIIAWRSNNAEENVYRQEAHDKQMRWLLERAPKDVQIRVITWNWLDSYERYSGVTYIDSQQTFQAGEGRNTLLYHFYQSQDDWALFLDDDIIPAENEAEGTENVWTFMEKNPSIFDHVDSFTLGLAKWKRDYAPYDHMMKVMPELSGGCFVFKNFWKHYSKELYFPIDPILEDHEMLFTLAYEGMRHFSLWNPWAKEFPVKSIQFSTREERSKKNSTARRRMAKRWGPHHPAVKTSADGSRLNGARKFMTDYVGHSDIGIKADELTFVVKNEAGLLKLFGD